MTVKNGLPNSFTTTARIFLSCAYALLDSASTMASSAKASIVFFIASSLADFVRYRTPVGSADVTDLSRIIRGPFVSEGCINKTYGVVARLPVQRLPRLAV